MCAPSSQGEAHCSPGRDTSSPLVLCLCLQWHKGCPHKFLLELLPWPQFLGGQPDSACQAPHPGPWMWPQEPGDSCLSSAALEILSDTPLWLRGPRSCDPRWDVKSEPASPCGQTQPASSQAGCLSANPPSANLPCARRWAGSPCVRQRRSQPALGSAPVPVTMPPAHHLQSVRFRPVSVGSEVGIQAAGLSLSSAL